MLKTTSFIIKTAFATFWGHSGRNWATFKCSVWSHWSESIINRAQVLMFYIILTGRKIDIALRNSLRRQFLHRPA